MNIKRFSLLAGIAAITLTSFPMAVNAQELPPFLSNLNITDQQKEQFEDIINNTDSKIEDILTPDQQRRFQTIKVLRRQLKDAREGLNLSEEQLKQMQDINRSARFEMRGILTEEQRQQIRQEIGAFRGKGPLRRRFFQN
ncbi:hypothetical protein BJP34_01280 [Moorena producens PAL-8-15-08-1]|uniref:P pilus assembly/Cpx signaling pathway, periplasmic inhibitor/zinc-resistance associated protein n=1 Tax=Moorena producens PAL-8-15-08-1 TaxID=1458985 RepID=A0A1D8TKX1_9CYAN|nr:hypothetical protein [Moorena producens]AOW98254.1 hypothetical protein BJP34_01280 [Moorena producens PAL-8-15-08-1]